MIHKIVYALATVAILTSCNIYQPYTKVKGCKGVRLINYDQYTKRDSSGLVLKKNLDILDDILSKSLDLGIDSIKSDTDNEIEVSTTGTRSMSLTTPNEIVSAFNSKVNLICAKQGELLKQMRDARLPESFRNKAGDKYLELLDNYTAFSDQLADAIKKK